MSIKEILSKRIENVKLHNTQPVLKPGQIVQGKIIKLYPNNKAQIQIGSQKLIAQLEASLSIGENYHFQVKNNSDVTHLKVLGEQLKQNASANMQTLLQGLGVKASKANIVVMQQLMREKIPFNREQLMKAFQLLEGASNKTHAQTVIRNMLVHHLPVTDSVFQALYSKSTTSFGDQMNDLLQQLKQDLNQTPLKQNMIQRLASLTEHTQTNKALLIKHILSEIEVNNTDFFNASKAAGTVDRNVNFSTWKSEWQNFAKNNFGSVSVSNISLSNQQANVLSLPFKLNTSEIMNDLNQFLRNKSLVMNQAQSLLQQFSSVISKANIHQIPITTSDFSNLKLQIERDLLPLMTVKQQQQVTGLLQNNTTSLNQLLALLKTVSSEQTYVSGDQFVQSTKTEGNVLAAKPHEQFMIQLKQVLQSTGFAHEFNIANDLPEQQATTIKSLAIQLLQQSDGVVSERAQQLLQFINGMQLQSVNETSNLLQANLQIPGEKLGLNKDLDLEFESRKTESGKIDPAYCRIMFYLDLSNLKETIIDMNIQKRAVAVTVFNDSSELESQSQELKPVLKKGLEALDYHLSTITIKPLKQINTEIERQSLKQENSSYQGVDYRI